MNQQLSNKIKALSFLTMIMVLFIHSFNLYSYPFKIAPETSYSFKIQNFISFHICRIAVPFFFILSGFLFINKINLTSKKYFEKIANRFQSLVIPYVLWVIIWTMLFSIISNLPFISSFINSPLDFKNLSFDSIFKIINSPICYQFWFIKDLIFLVLLSPLIYIAIKKIPYIFIFLLFINLIYFHIDLYLFQLQSIFYFSIGFLIALRFNSYCVSKLEINYKWIGVFWFLLYFINSFKYQDVFTPFVIFIGIIFIWKAYDAVNQDRIVYVYLLKCSKYSFFLFAFHEPLQISFKKIGFTILGKTEAVSLILYFLIPIIVFFVSINLGKLTQKLVPKLYAVLTGGR
jgi:surface polysaccharide O-acyltransferase-like enzyme